VQVTPLADGAEARWGGVGQSCGIVVIGIPLLSARGCGLRRTLGGGRLEQLTGPPEIGSGRGAEEAVVADLGEAPGEDVLEEAGDEVVNGKGDAAGLAGTGVGVAEGDPAVLEAFDAVVGQGHAVDVAG